MPLTVDASVFIASAQADEVHHADSLRFTIQLPLSGEVIICPALVLTECSAALARRTGSVALAGQITNQVQTFPNLHLISLTASRAGQAAELAAQYRLRGADSIYVVVAEEFGTTLVTWDGEMHTRGANVVTAVTPAEWLTAQTGSGN